MPGPVVYVPSRVGEGYFTDWQAPVSGDNGKVWAYNHGTGKFEPYTIPTVAPGGSSGYIQYNNAGAFGASGVYWDAANSRVGINATPSETLSVYNPVNLAWTRFDANRISSYYNTEAQPRYQIAQNAIPGGGSGFLFGIGSSNTIDTTGVGVGISATRTFSIFTSNGTALTERVTVNGSGNVGIGTTSPGQKLDVNGSVNVATALIVPDVRPAINSTNATGFSKADGTRIVTVDTTNGRVGIGTVSPNNKLDVAGTVQMDGLRIDVTPTAETVTATHTVTFSANGINYKLLCVPA